MVETQTDRQTVYLWSVWFNESKRWQTEIHNLFPIWFLHWTTYTHA